MRPEANWQPPMRTVSNPNRASSNVQTCQAVYLLAGNELLQIKLSEVGKLCRLRYADILGSPHNWRDNNITNLHWGIGCRSGGSVDNG